MSIKCGTLLVLLVLIYLSAAIEEPDVAPKSVNISATNQILIGDTLYYFEKKIPRHWFDARKYCEGMDYNLISLETADKFKAIKSYLNSQKDTNHYWTSGNDFLTPDSHVWFPSQKKVASNLWHPHEPNNKRGIEHCDELKYMSGTHLLNDFNCIIERLYICERTLW